MGNLPLTTRVFVGFEQVVFHIYVKFISCVSAHLHMPTMSFGRIDHGQNYKRHQ